MQCRKCSSTSATAERELNLSLGGDGTIRLQNGGGLFSIGSAAGSTPSAASVAQLEASMSLLAQSGYEITATWGNPLFANDRPAQLDQDMVVKVARLDGPIEVDYWRQGGILPAVLRRLARESADA